MLTFALLACSSGPDDSGKPVADSAADTADTSAVDSGDSSGADDTDTDTGDSGGSGATLSVLIPLYVWPAPGAWDEVYAAADAHPDAQVVAIVNVNSAPYIGGPDAPSDDVDPTYADAIATLTSHGIVAIGYVPTGYAHRDSGDVVAMAQAWRGLYPEVSGIFLDEVSSDAADVAWLQTVATGIAGVGGLDLVLGNPGTTPDASYAGVLDGLVVYESAGLPELTTLPTSIPIDQTGLLPYGVASLPTEWLTSAREQAHWIYVAEDAANPWGEVSPYLDTLLTP